MDGAHASEQSSKRWSRLWKYGVALLVILIIALYLWAKRHILYTGDAYIEAPWVPISARVSGPIVRVFVENNTWVEAGDTLFEVDSIPHQIAVERMQGKLSLAVTQGELQIAQADLAEAEYGLEQTQVKAPVSGWITGFRLRPGEYVDADTELFSIVDPSQWWATARFKDITLSQIQPGARALVWVDMHWDKLFGGYVQGIEAGVNRQQASPLAAPSALPYVEQTEFWIRLAQRFPVQIVIDDPRARNSLKVGANCRVWISRSSQPVENGKAETTTAR